MLATKTTIWPGKPEIFAAWLFTREVCWASARTELSPRKNDVATSCNVKSSSSPRLKKWKEAGEINPKWYIFWHSIPKILSFPHVTAKNLINEIFHIPFSVKSLGPAVSALLISARTGCAVSVCFSGCILSAQQPRVAHSCQIEQWPFGSFHIVTSWIILRWVSGFFFSFGCVGSSLVLRLFSSCREQGPLST